MSTWWEEENTVLTTIKKKAPDVIVSGGLEVAMYNRD